MTTQAQEKALITEQLTCFNCDHKYAYLGAHPHPGVCPECGERTVSPSSEISLEDIEVYTPDAGNHDLMLRIPGEDASGRVYEYWLCADVDEDDAILVRVTIAGQPVRLVTAVQTAVVVLSDIRAALETFDSRLTLRVFGGASA